MKVLDLLGEIEEIVDTSSGVPLTGKIMVDSNEILQLVNEIKDALPDEIQQAQWIKNERDRILGEAKTEYETIINNAQQQAEEMIETSDILTKARDRAEETRRTTEDSVRQLKLFTYDYVDRILFDFQDKMDDLSSTYFNDMFKSLESTFNSINATLAANRDEIKEMAYRTSMNLEGDLVRHSEKNQDSADDYEEYPDDYEE